MREAGELGILQIHLSGGEPTVRRDLEEIIKAAAEAGLYTNLITAAVLLNARAPAEAQGGRPRPRPDLDPGRRRRRGERRPHRRLQGRQRQEERGRGLGARARHAADDQRADPPPQHQKRRSHHRLRGVARRRPGRDRARAVLRLGAQEPRRADAGARGLHDGGADHRESARAPEGHHRHRHGRARLLRQVPQALHGRLGPRHHQHHPARARAALPRRGIDPRVSSSTTSATSRWARSGSTVRRSRSTAAPTG